MKKPELLLGPIVGDLSHDHVKLWGRTSSKSTLYGWINDSGQVKQTGSTPVDSKTGFAGVVPIHGLRPDTWYRYALTLSDERPPAETFGRFKTGPEPGRPKSFSFTFGSCFLPFLDEPGTVFQRILRMHGQASFLLLIGDQVYADLWKYNGLKDHVAITKDDYDEIYRYSWSNKYMRKLLKNLPVFMTLDDHEVDNDWHWKGPTREYAVIGWFTKMKRQLRRRPPEEIHLSLERIQNALQSYWEHQGIHGPDLLIPESVIQDQVQLEPSKPFSFAYTFTYGKAAFFVMDTRTKRMRRFSKGEVLGIEQLLIFKAWLGKVKDRYPIKFVVTSTAFLQFLFGDYSLDRWSGFPRERDRILRYIQEHEIEGIHFLTGDLHTGHAISIDIKGKTGKDIRVWEFCASPFEQKTNPLISLLTLHQMPHKLWKNYKVHFSKANINYGVVNVDFDAAGSPKVGFELHYVEKDGKWKVNRPRN
jgi:phosphodiesterase/alkaline phosphatase D-like protein